MSSTRQCLSLSCSTDNSRSSCPNRCLPQHVLVIASGETLHDHGKWKFPLSQWRCFHGKIPTLKAVIFSSDFPCLITRGCVILNHPSTAILSLSYFMIREKPIMKNSICRYYKPESCSSGLAINLPISLVLQFMGHPGFARCDSSTRWALQKLWYIDHLICHKPYWFHQLINWAVKKGL